MISWPKTNVFRTILNFNRCLICDSAIAGQARTPALRLSTMAEKNYIVKIEDAKNFVVSSMVAIGTQPSHAQALADVLVLADQRGHYSHGLNRLEKYVNEVKSKSVIVENDPFIEKETVSTALVNGNNAMGCVVGNFAMSVAIKKAKEAGVGWVAANHSNHYGIAGMYSLQAVEQGLMGFSFTNSSPFLVPTRSKERYLGTNPITCAAPSTNPDDPFVLDMATTAVAQGKVEVAKRKDVKLPNGWGTNSSGENCTDPREVLKSGGLYPLGGPEETSGYKGSGLAMMVEILCGILSGSHYGSNVRTWQSNEGYANLGQCFIAVNPEMFAPGFQARLADLMKGYRELKPADGQEAILVAGDPERLAMKKVEEDGGILYHPNFITYLDGLAKECQVEKIARQLHD
ncbi:hypothetical protein EB796_009363 [Bugula neritina]|uniref:Malate dehydrogenase n=1 Tax=Bugula neritina TaxID=10212 RepID=A0A7J7K140_BUGNE|nr:hypothetical protein EB796_009363 [Bugula neritina]